MNYLQLCLLFICQTVSIPFHDQTHVGDLNIKVVHYSDPNVILNKNFFRTFGNSYLLLCLVSKASIKCKIISYPPERFIGAFDE